MSFLKDLRRRSRASFRSSSTNNNDSSLSNGQSQSQDDVVSSSTTRASSQDQPKTPPASLAPEHPHPPSSTVTTLARANGSCAAPPTPRQGPVPISSQSSRSSVMGGNSMSANGAPRPPVPVSPLAPRIESISENSWVHQKVLLVYGRIGDSHQRPTDGTLTISHAQESVPPTCWPTRESTFKALVHLVPGPNRIRLDYTPPGPAHATVHSSWVGINYLPPLNVPPLQLAIVLGRDSDGRFATGSENDTAGEFGLDAAIRKFRVAAYLWQAFTGEQMYRNRFGRRCFRYEEEWQPGTLGAQDVDSDQMRSEAKVHIVRCDETVAELRALGARPSNDNTLYNVAKNAIKKHFNLQPGQKQYVSALMLDNDWNAETETARGNAAACSSKDGLNMAIFSSHGLHTYPSCIEEVVPALTDFRRAEDKVNGNNEYTSNWETTTSSIGVQLRGSGRVFGCPGGGSGIMGSAYIPFNRTFTVWEPCSTRTKSQGLKLCTKEDEAGWSRLEALRFRFHPCFRLPADGPVSEEPIQVWPVDNGKLVVISAPGVAFAEIFVDDNDEICRGDMEFVNSESGSSSTPKQVTLTEQSVRHGLSESYKKSKKLKLVIYSGSLRTYVVEDFVQLVKSKQSIVKLPKGQTGYRGPRIRSSPGQNSTPEELVLQCTTTQTKLLVSIKLYLDAFITGIEFCYEDSTTQLFGRKTDETPKGEFVLDTRRGEVIMGFYLRYGQFVEGLDIWTSLGRKSGIYGNPTGGTGHTLVPPRGYSVAGISGTVGSYIDSFGLIITH